MQGRPKHGSRRAIAFIGMSGVGKTRLSHLLRSTGEWFHYSIDYRIGTHYMDEAIVDNVKKEAMQVPFLRGMLLSDSIYIKSNITFENLEPLSTYLGKPGAVEKGGLPFEEYIRRQKQHRLAETRALIDTQSFIEKSYGIYGYPHFVCDTGGSICEVVDPENEQDPVLTALSDCSEIIYLREDEAHHDLLSQRFDRAPKPMYFNEGFLRQCWTKYLEQHAIAEEKIDPDDFMRWAFRQLLKWRRPRYEAIGRNWGRILDISQFETIQTAAELVQVIFQRSIANLDIIG